MTRRTFPMDRRKPVTSVRYDGDGVSLLVTAGGIEVDRMLSKTLTDREAFAIALGLEAAGRDHKRLRSGQHVDHEGATTS